jgi:4-hydroxy-3-polyprenylbenzoate decarboxylase
MPLEVVIGISGASGVCYGIRLLEVMTDCVTHLVMTENARIIIEIETEKNPRDVEKLADHCYAPEDWTAAIASGSYLFDAMVVAPCSMRTLAGIAAGLSDTLITRAADICLKERRRLVLLTRETPLSLVHLKNMVSVTEAGAIVMPASPPFYPMPKNMDEVIDIVIGRTLDLIGVKHDLFQRWGTSERKCL